MALTIDKSDNNGNGIVTTVEHKATNTNNGNGSTGRTAKESIGRDRNNSISQGCISSAKKIVAGLAHGKCRHG